jgi:hypothetical protein
MKRWWWVCWFFHGRWWVSKRGDAINCGDGQGIFLGFECEWCGKVWPQGGGWRKP